jgi:hypothetical protein
MARFPAVLIVATLSGCAPAARVPPRVETIAVSTVAPVERGADDWVYPSPDGTAQLVWATTAPSGGDFPLAPVYVQSASRTVLLGEFRNVRDVRWSLDSRGVTFDGSEVATPGTLDVSAFEYRVGEPSLRRRWLRRVDDQPTG